MKLLTSLTLGLLIQNASAQSTITDSYGMLLSYTTTELNQNGELDLFDSNLGTLTGAVLTLRTGLGSTVSLENTGAATEFTEVSFFVNFKYTSTDNSSLNNLLTGSTGTVRNQVWEFEPFELDPFETIQIPVAKRTVSKDVDLASILFDIQAPGGGIFTLNATTASSLALFGGGGNLLQYQATEGAAGARITYTYDAIPEPSSSGMALLGISALVLRRRRR